MEIGAVGIRAVGISAVEIQLEDEVVHAPPEDGLSFYPCCDRTRQDLGAYDRVATRRDEITCGRFSPMDELLLNAGLEY